MENIIQLYISSQIEERQNILAKIHAIIIETDKSIEATLEPMMGKEMIVYKTNGLMKYGLAGTKNYMTLHVLPIYGSKLLFAKYKALLHKANFQKGCINFKNENTMPLHIVQNLITDCAKVDIVKFREDYLKSKK